MRKFNSIPKLSRLSAFAGAAGWLAMPVAGLAQSDAAPSPIDAVPCGAEEGSVCAAADFQTSISPQALPVSMIAAAPLSTSPDTNIARVDNAVRLGSNAGTISAGNLAILNAQTSTAAYQAALLGALPSITEGAGREIFEAASVSSRALDRNLAAESGAAVWGQIAVRGASQDALSLSSPGYRSDQLIATIGADFTVFEDARVGALVSFADIDSDDRAGQGGAKTAQVESLKLGIYASVEFFERGFFNAEVAYLTGDIASARTSVFGTITSDYGFDALAGRATLGFDLLPDENVSITPSIGLDTMRIDFDDVRETGGFGFLIERGDAEYIELRAGVELGAQMSDGVSGFVAGHVIHDLVDTVRSFRLSSAEISTFFPQLPLREQNRFELNAGLNIDLSDSAGLEIGYHGDFNEGYSGHAARASIRLEF